MREVLVRLGVPPHELANIGSHSCKATLLSWLAKAVVEHGGRRLLGGHFAVGDQGIIESLSESGRRFFEENPYAARRSQR